MVHGLLPVLTAKSAVEQYRTVMTSVVLNKIRHLPRKSAFMRYTTNFAANRAIYRVIRVLLRNDRLQWMTKNN